MKRITFARLAVLMLAVAGLALQGCGGDDNGYTISAEDQARIDALTADLADANERADDAEEEVETLEAAQETAAADLQAAQDRLTAAQSAVEELTAQIGMMPSADDPNGSGLQGQLALANEELSLAQTAVATLMTEIGEYPSAENDNIGSGLKGQVATAQAAQMQAEMDAADLRADIGSFPDADGLGGSGLRGQLRQAQDALTEANMEVTRLTTLIGDADAEGSLEQRLAAANMRVATLEGMIGEMSDMASDAEGASLYAKLNYKAEALMTANGTIESLNAMIGEMGDDASDAEGASLYAKLNYKAEALMTANGTIMDLRGMIGMMDDTPSDAADASLYAKLNYKADEIAKLEMQIGDPADAADPASTASLHAQLKAAKDDVAMLTQQLETATQRIMELEQQQADQTSRARGSAYQTAMLGNRVPAAQGVPVAPGPPPVVAINTARQLPFAIASTAAGPHAITYTTTGGITLAGFQGPTSTVAPATPVPNGTGWHTATMTRTVPDGPTPASLRAGTQTAVVYTDTLGVALLNNYAYFGWWEHRPTLAGNAHAVEAFAGGTDPVAVANYNQALATSPLNVVGTATYTGLAAGKYASRQISGGLVTSIDSGSFTANASLTANFGTSAVPHPTSGVGAVSGAQVNGTISEFMLSSGNAAQWVVLLNQDANGLGTAGNDDGGLFAGTTTLTVGPGIQRTGNAGNWVGEFFGPRTQPVTGGATQEIAPQTIVGTFDASDRATNPLLTIHGAFGAEN